MDITPLMQRIFDRGVRGVIMQDRQCEDHGSCRYRHNGDKCVLGHVLDDTLYTEDLEGAIPHKYHAPSLCGAPHIVKNNKKMFRLLVYSNSDDPASVMRSSKARIRLSMLFQRMQAVHDGCCDPEEWIGRFKTVAQNFGLDDSIVDRAVRARGILG